jgi:hypothetical protein
MRRFVSAIVAGFARVNKEACERCRVGKAKRAHARSRNLAAPLNVTDATYGPHRSTRGHALSRFAHPTIDNRLKTHNPLQKSRLPTRRFRGTN